MNYFFRFSLLMGLSYLIQTTTLAQSAKYWIFFSSKDTTQSKVSLSPETYQNRAAQGLPLFQASDLLVNPDFLTQLKAEGIRLEVSSKWLNACSAYLTKEQLMRVQRFPFVFGIKLIRQDLRITEEKKDSSFKSSIALEQLNAEYLLEQNLTGEGVTVGVIDAGFFGVQRSRFLRHLLDKNQILGFRDYVKPDNEEFFTRRQTPSDNHGTTVLRYLTGIDSAKNQREGLAVKSKFYLARTDHGTKEFRGEEDYWVAALEWMDSLGVRLINTSLGYSVDFDNPEEDYLISEMDGKTAITTRAAEIAATQKGMIIVCSAGNEGNRPDWGIISAPADAEHVLAVGATNPQGFKMGYSSLGTSNLPYLKPDVVIHASSGTSFAAPVITGFIACLLQAHPDASQADILAAVRQSANAYPFGNYHLGYGIPNAALALRFLKKKKLKMRIKEVKGGHSHYILKEEQAQDFFLIHKSDAHTVLRQELSSSQKIKRFRKAVRTTVLWEGGGVEIIWK